MDKFGRVSAGQLSLEGQLVTQVIFNPGSVELRLIEGLGDIVGCCGHSTFTIDGTHYRSDIGLRNGGYPSDAGSLTALLGQRIRAARLDDISRLRIDFDSGDTLMFAPFPDYESWQITWKDGTQVICLAGGEQAWFRPGSVDRIASLHEGDIN